MKIKLLGIALALSLVVAPLAAIAGGVGGGNANSNWTIYGWQNYEYQFIDADGTFENADGRDFQRIQAGAANIGFAASIDTGMSMGGEAVKANVQCEQFTFYNDFSGGSGWCNRNSKLSLSGAFGEIGFMTWLLPFNEMVAQWVDPFYDASATSHTSIMGNVGFGGLFYNTGNFDATGGNVSDFDFNGLYSLSFNRRQENLVQYFSPNFNGFTFRFAMTAGSRNETLSPSGEELDPNIYSTGIAYENTLANGNNVWLAVTYEKHDEWTAAELNRGVDFGAGRQFGDANDCDDSDDDAYRIAGRYIHQWGNGSFSRISAMWESLEYDADCVNEVLWSDVERDSWMVSGVHNFGNGFDVRFSYMDADELDCPSGTCGRAGFYNGGPFSDNDTDANAYNIGLYYTMPAGTEVRFTYSAIDNEDNSAYDFGIGGVNLLQGEDADFFAIGLTQWF